MRSVVLTVDDPFITEIVAKMCEKAEEIAWHREYRIFNVTFEEAEIQRRWLYLNNSSS